MVTDLFDIHAPLKHVRVKYPPAPWLTQPIKNMMLKRDRAKRLLKKFSTEDNLASYKKLRNRCSKMCRDAKRLHIHHSIQDASPSQMWKFLKSLGLGKGSSDSNVISFDLNSINSHFSKSPLCLDASIKRATINELSRLPRPDCSPFNFSEVAEGEVKKFLNSISTKAVGTDGINTQMLQLLSSELAPAITHLINYSLETSSFPSAWKAAYVIPLPKTSNPTTVSQFRPISILPVLSKILENVVAEGEVKKFLNSISTKAVGTDAYGLLVNPSKSQAMIIGSPYMLNIVTHSPSVLYGGVPIMYSSKAKNLGVIFDNQLSWSSHVNELQKLALCFYDGDCTVDHLEEFVSFEYSYSGGMSVRVTSEGARAAGRRDEFTLDVNDMRHQVVQLMRSYAPEGYQAPGFEPSSEEMDQLAIATPASNRLGHVTTAFHDLVANCYNRDTVASQQAQPSENSPVMTQNVGDLGSE
ncbi:DNA, W-Samurai RAPD marker in retrotranposable element (reverse transcriptase), strain p50 [Operophtera brumata]|uniref:DNA, W-Samurai RAPD marker in retrotranposable element (Reverse transcriptase), strain p50 n=1 Tax=Operophtera brumata TaxID=104452 RepID=A0A0L7LV16_OPEBR|nr:DNA, W-Samurai RAPD marker in retrotranposable element (reverse transcriptase), strain p50 [Operophtera brumata]